MLKDGSVVDGRYVVESKLGEGGLAAVFKVRHRKLRTTYALKLLRRDSPSIRRRLLREGELQAKLRHPNIAAVTDIVDIDGVPGLIMEFVRGSSLDVLLHNEGLTMDQVDHLAEGILRGVGAAHAAGTIHRDLKPANILIEVVDGIVVPKVTDFGLAKAFDGYNETAAGTMMGTPQYMAPEQIEDASSVDQRADVFSLGVMLYEMVSGERPFDGVTIPEVLQKVLDNERRPIGEVAPHIPMNKQRAIEEALAVDPARRPDVAALLELWRGKTLGRASAAFTSSVIERALGRGGGTALEAASQAPPPPQDPEETFADLDALPGASRRALAPPPWWRGWLVGGGVLAFLLGSGVAVVGTGLFAFLVGRGTASDPFPPSQQPVSAPASSPPRPVPPAPTAPVSAPVQPVPARPVPAPPAEPAPAPVVPSPRPMPPSQPAPTPSPMPVPAPAPAPVRPVPQAMVRVAGDATSVRLVGPEGSFGMGSVPPGSYDVMASFGSEAPRKASTTPVQVGAGEEVTIECSSFTYTCGQQDP